MSRIVPADRNRALDGLRGLAALSVVTFHVWDYARPVPHATFQSASDYVMNEGRLGLVLFFVLSGFLLYRPWVSAALSGAARPRHRAYLIRRVARIVPAYYLALVGSVALLWGAAGTPGVRLPPATALPLFAVFAQNFSPSALLTLDPPTWTLSIEASFYLVLPLVGLAAARLGSSRWNQVAPPIAIIAAGLAWNRLTGLAEPFDKALPAALPYFGAGMLVAVLANGRAIAPRTARWLLLGGIGAVVLDGALHEGMVPPAVEPLVSGTLRDLPAAAGFAAVVAAVAYGEARAAWASWTPLVALGTISYGVYLWHLPLLLALRSANALPLELIPALAVVLPATVMVATASWFGLERPMIRWASRVTRRPAEHGERRAQRPTLAEGRA
ncbi:MAG: acyltransferase family protein [Solirubrobacterales bacterium]